MGETGKKSKTSFSFPTKETKSIASTNSTSQSKKKISTTNHAIPVSTKSRSGSRSGRRALSISGKVLRKRSSASASKRNKQRKSSAGKDSSKDSLSKQSSDSYIPLDIFPSQSATSSLTEKVDDSKPRISRKTSRSKSKHNENKNVRKTSQPSSRRSSGRNDPSSHKNSIDPNSMRDISRSRSRSGSQRPSQSQIQSQQLNRKYERTTIVGGRRSKVSLAYVWSSLQSMGIFNEAFNRSRSSILGPDNVDEVKEDSDDSQEIRDKEYAAEEQEEDLAKQRELLRVKLESHYHLTQKEYLHSLKTNAYLQDRLYQICVRKGYIVEVAAQENKRERNKKKRNNNLLEKLKGHFEAMEISRGVEDDDNDESDEDAAKQAADAALKETTSKHLDRHRTFTSSHDFIDPLTHPSKQSQDHVNGQGHGHGQGMPSPNPSKNQNQHQSDHQDKVENENKNQLYTRDREKSHHENKKNSFQLHNSKSHYIDTDVNTGTQAFREQKRLMRYNKLIRHIHHLERTKDQIAIIVDQRIDQLKIDNKTYEKTTTDFFDEFMSQIRIFSRESLHQTGKHMNSHETEQYIVEMNQLFQKLQHTTLEFYKNWHGLNYSLKRMEETGSHGDKAFEYEQLCGENYALQERVEYRESELEKAKGKITHAIQLLAHIKEKANKIQQTLDEGTNNLDMVNKRIQKLISIREVANKKCTDLKNEEKILQGQSHLIDNPRLLRDLKKTSATVNDLKQQKSKIKEKLHSEHVKIEAIKKQIETHKRKSINQPETVRTVRKVNTSRTARTANGTRTTRATTTTRPTTAPVSLDKDKDNIKLTFSRGRDRNLNADDIINDLKGQVVSNSIPSLSTMEGNVVQSESFSYVSTIQPEVQPQQQQEQQLTHYYHNINSNLIQRNPTASIQNPSANSNSSRIKKRKGIVWNRKTERLLELLEKRHNEPWKQVREQLQVIPKFAISTPNRTMTTLTTIPC